MALYLLRTVLTLQKASFWYFRNKKMHGIIEFVFEIWSAKIKIWGVFKGFSCYNGNFLLHENDRIFFSNNWCLIWYQNIAVEWWNVVVSILITRSFESVETGLSHLKCYITLHYITLYYIISISLKDKTKFSSVLRFELVIDIDWQKRRKWVNFLLLSPKADKGR